MNITFYLFRCFALVTTVQMCVCILILSYDPNSHKLNPSSSLQTLNSGAVFGYEQKMIPMIPYDSNIFKSKNTKMLDSEKTSIHVYNLPRFLGKLETYVKTCSSECQLTSGNKYLQNKDIVLFHWPFLRLAHPPRKKTGQVWVFFGAEAPVTVRQSFKFWKNKINWTMTNRRDSDIISPAYTLTYKNNWIGKQHMAKNWLDKSEGNADVAWFVSHCKTASRREKYVKRMKSNLAIDVYGKCGTRQCLINNYTKYCENLLNNKYKLYLAFENSLCRDYITEKAFRTANIEVIPIVRGIGELYSLYLPPMSYINTADFQSPYGLSQFVNKISKSENYKYYFAWKQYFDLKRSLDTVFCDLCRMFRESKISAKYHRIYGNINTWLRGSHKAPFCRPVVDIRRLFHKTSLFRKDA